MQTWVIKDEETGELINTNSKVKTVEDKEQDKLNKITKMNQQGLIHLRGIKEERHSKVYHRRRMPIENWKYKGYMCDLILTLCKYTNEISLITEQGKCKPMDKDDIIEYLGISTSTFYEFIKDVKSRGIVSEVTFDINDIKRTSFVVNPAYTNNGMYLDIFTFRAFETDKVFRSILTEYHILQAKEADFRIIYDKGNQSS